jgi:hypothetical protein
MVGSSALWTQDQNYRWCWSKHETKVKYFFQTWMWALADAKALFRFQRPQAPELEGLQTPHRIQIVCLPFELCC